ncbi:SEC-C domain-containing protein [Archangium violaceum]|uniref:YecA family protein n=1 Tax=Archangium violaceum TaxID=83451 RepID=UPI00193B61BE|nr:SEC-C metal-binding domain-containing protein [Archangium violaceum]QRK10312.1 SEC-C domain-containing protein [Archangium violaceum]
MSREKPGRNDPCPCGSGKKYKACHAAEDRAREAAAAPPAPPQHPLANDLQAAMNMLGEADLTRVSETLDRLGELLTRWGPAPGLRFDAQAFDTYVSRELERLESAVERDPGQARNVLRLGTVRELGTRSFLEKLRATLLARATTAGLTSEERQALCLGALLASTPKSGRFQPEDRPVLDVVFGVQFREWGASQGQKLAAKLETLAENADLSDEAREVLRKAGEGEMGPLVKYVESAPRLAARIAQEARERSERVEAAMRQSNTPSVFAPEELVWLTSVLWEPLNALRSPDLDAQARGKAVSSFLASVRTALDSDKQFLTGLLDRLRILSKDAALDEMTRDFYTDAAVAFEAEPVRMVLAAILTSRSEPRARSAEEQVVRADLEARTRWTAEDLEPYRELLERMNLPAPAERIRRAQEWLRAHPIAM